MPNSQPISTSPLYASDELVAVRARGDYMTLSSPNDLLAYGNDGIIAAGSPWTLTSASVDFNAQGIQPNNVVELKVPGTKGGATRLFAVDGVEPNTLMLRMINMAPNVGQPPTLTGATSITFAISTFFSLIEEASRDLKNLLGIDEMIPFHSSSWQYQGLDDPYRDERTACVLGVLIKALKSETRTKDGDFWQKLNELKTERTEVIEKLQIRWGPFGNSQAPSTPSFSTGLSR